MLFAVFVWRAVNDAPRLMAWLLTVAFAYGAAAQLVPGWALPAALAALAAAAFLLLQRREEPAAEIVFAFPAAAMIVLLAVAGIDPLGEWHG